MNKFQKVACQIARDNMKKPLLLILGATFNNSKNAALKVFRKNNATIKDAIEFKNFSKNELL